MVQWSSMWHGHQYGFALLFSKSSECRTIFCSSSPFSAMLTEISQPFLITRSRSTGLDGLWSFVEKDTLPSPQRWITRESPTHAIHTTELWICRRMQTAVVPAWIKLIPSTSEAEMRSACIRWNADVKADSISPRQSILRQSRELRK